MIAGVFLLIVIPLLGSIVVFILRRFQTMAAFVSAGLAGVLGLGAWWLPFGQPVQIGSRQVMLGEPVELLGRQLILTPADRAVLALIFMAGAGLFLAGWRARPGTMFFPLGLALLGLLSAALVIRPFVYASLLLTIAAVLATILVQAGSPGRTRGVARYLVIMTLALPAFLIAGWLADLYKDNPTDLWLARGIMLSLGVGFSLLLSVVPFHIWINPMVVESPPVAAVFVLGLFNSVTWFVLFEVMQEFTWLSADPNLFRVMAWAGLATAVAGGGLAFSSRDFAHVMSYGVLADYGCTLLAFAMHSLPGLAAVLMATMARPVSLTILALGITLARERVKTSEFEKLAGIAWNSPWTTVALIVGGFSVAGIPPLAGFAGRWSEVRLLATTQPTFALVLLGVTVGVAAGVLRGVDYVCRPPDESPSAVRAMQNLREPRLMALIIVASLVVGFAFGLFPGIVEPAVRTVLSSYTFFSAP